MTGGRAGPALISFDIFGTVIDWRAGLMRDLSRYDIVLRGDTFDAVIDAQGADEQAAFRPYADIVARSLVTVCALEPTVARGIGAGAGRWPVYPDAAEALTRLARIAPLAALTNSDLAHREPVEAQLGRSFTHWVCAEEVGAYKPDPRMWQALAARAGASEGPAWWHASAYSDYDLAAARALGLTCVFVDRPHARRGDAGMADLSVPDLGALADRLGAPL